MTLASRFMGQALKLPPPSNQVVVHHDLRVPMPDGVVLLADHYFPQRRSPQGRSPQGRSPQGRSPQRRYPQRR
jgi:hypothetical protein